MGFNKRYINYQSTIIALQSNTLKDYYGKSDAFIFDDERSEKVYNLFVEGKTTDDILKFLNNEEVFKQT
jgi:hypothetical protein